VVTGDNDACGASIMKDGTQNRHERAHSSSAFVVVLSQINPAQVLWSCFFKIHSRTIHATLPVSIVQG